VNPSLCFLVALGLGFATVLVSASTLVDIEDKGEEAVKEDGFSLSTISKSEDHQGFFFPSASTTISSLPSSLEEHEITTTESTININLWQLGHDIC